jgi:norsolorinic acid ketoreductase
MPTYLITGANRGIGRGLTDLILARHTSPPTTVIALVRDMNHATSRSLAASASKNENTNKLIMLPYDAHSADSASKAISRLAEFHITHLDVVIANAGTLSWRGPALDTPAEAIHDAVTVNAVGPLLLFRACLPLLTSDSRCDSNGMESESEGVPKFIAISSAIGSTTLIPQLRSSQTLAYGVSKASLNHIVRKLAVDYPDIVVEAMTPGPVRTDLMRDHEEELQERLKKDPALAGRFVDIDKVCSGLLGLIDDASIDAGAGAGGTTGGFRDWKGEVVPW